MTIALRWGIVTAGKISHDFCVALSTLPFDEHQIVAVAARDKQKAEEFAKKHEIPNAFGSYCELAEWDIDIAYVAALNPQHFEICMLMLKNGKHVLCEKPLCMNHKQAKKLIQYAEMKKLFLMEAVWSRKKSLGGGTCLDLGIYTIQCAQWAFQEPPQQIVAKGTLNADGVDVEAIAELRYSGNRKATCHFSGERLLDNKAVIKGTKGEITFLQFWSPTKIIDIDGKEKEWVLPKGKYPTNFPNSEGMRYEAAEARQCILEGKLQSEHVSHNDSLLFAQIEDEIRAQLGVIYKEDKEQ